MDIESILLLAVIVFLSILLLIAVTVAVVFFYLDMRMGWRDRRRERMMRDLAECVREVVKETDGMHRCDHCEFTNDNAQLMSEHIAQKHLCKSMVSVDIYIFRFDSENDAIEWMKVFYPNSVVDWRGKGLYRVSFKRINRLVPYELDSE